MDWIAEGGFMAIFLSLFILAAVPAAIAREKGRNPVEWYIYGVLLWPVAFIHSLVITIDPDVKAQQGLRRGSHRNCPFCAETVRVEAILCRYCGSELPRIVSDAD